MMRGDTTSPPPHMHYSSIHPINSKQRTSDIFQRSHEAAVSSLRARCSVEQSPVRIVFPR